MATAHKTSTGCAFPPLSQSRQVAMACEAFYSARYVRGVPDIESEPARRGSEIHEVIADYIVRLRATNQATDYDYIREQARCASPEASEILDKFTESFIFDPETVLDIEQYITLDADFNVVDPDGPVEYEGTLDLVTMESERDCTIHDWKSFWSVVNADTFQSKLYPLLQFQTNPALETVRFVLFFVRYGVSREVTWTRSDVPKLMELARRERKRQLELHARDGAEAKASPGKQCSWCPIIESCPLGKVNPYLNLSPEQRLAKTAHLKEAYEYSLAVMKDLVVDGGPVECRDDNGNLLRAEFRPKTMKSYPLGVTLPILTDWTRSHPGDGAMIEGLTIGGLSSPAKAKKRSALAEQLQSVADVRVVTELKVGAAKDDEE